MSHYGILQQMVIWAVRAGTVSVKGTMVATQRRSVHRLNRLNRFRPDSMISQLWRKPVVLLEGSCINPRIVWVYLHPITSHR